MMFELIIAITIVITMVEVAIIHLTRTTIISDTIKMKTSSSLHWRDLVRFIKSNENSCECPVPIREVLINLEKAKN